MLDVAFELLRGILEAPLLTGTPSLRRRPARITFY
jgi:hypothetical protein